MGLLDIFSHNYPYTDFHELNLDWIINTILDLRNEMEKFVHKETIKIANPITWDIQTQYEASTIVYYDGKAYLSLQPVNGEALTDKDYWQLVYDFTFFGDNMINVKNCGAIGDGVHNDTDAINQALIIGEGHTIYFPEGTYLTDGIILPSNTSIVGFNMQKTIIKLKDGSTNHVISGGDFDINADGEMKDEPLGCHSSSIQNLTIDGNKTNCPEAGGGIMVYGFDLQFSQVTVHDCHTYGVYLESPGRLYSITTGLNLQNDVTNLTLYDCNKGELVYNGQSDSNIYNVLCYGSNRAEDYIHARFLNKANGCRVFGLHVWGTATYGVKNEANRSYFTNCHCETAEIAQFYTSAPVTFEGNCYLNNFDNDSCGILIDGTNSCFIRARCNRLKTCVKIERSAGQHNIEIIGYNGSVASQLLDGVIGFTDTFIGHLWGVSTEDIFHNKYFNFTNNSSDIIMHNANFHVRTQGNAISQFTVQATPEGVSGLSVIGGTGAIGGTLTTRGVGDDLDIEIKPKGNGFVRFGERVEESNITPDTTVSIKTSDGHVIKLLGKFVR